MKRHETFLCRINSNKHSGPLLEQTVFQSLWDLCSRQPPLPHGCYLTATLSKMQKQKFAELKFVRIIQHTFEQKQKYKQNTIKLVWDKTFLKHQTYRPSTSVLTFHSSPWKEERESFCPSWHQQNLCTFGQNFCVPPLSGYIHARKIHATPCTDVFQRIKWLQYTVFSFLLCCGPLPRICEWPARATTLCCGCWFESAPSECSGSAPAQ